MSLSSMKTVQGIECPVCKGRIYSRHTYDMRYCSCGYCYVDGRSAYLRFGWGEETSAPDGSSLAFETAGPPLVIQIQLISDEPSKKGDS